MRIDEPLGRIGDPKGCNPLREPGQPSAEDQVLAEHMECRLRRPARPKKVVPFTFWNSSKIR